MALVQRLSNLPAVTQSPTLRAFVTAAWLGWQIESNWARPFLFAVYAIARPISSVLILVVMYSVITNGATGEPIFAFIYFGNALYILVNSVVTGVSWAVIEDREHYRVAKQIYTAPMNTYAYLLGRGVARLIIGSVSVLITLVFGVIAFRIPLDINVLLLATATILGLASLSALGVILGAVTMQTARLQTDLGSLVSGGLYLFTGAIFPLDVLPAWLQPVGYLFPVTYWLEVTRRALLGVNSARFPTFASFSDWGLIGVLVVMTAGLWLISGWVYRASLRRSKEEGLLDIETNF
ncbi:MAG: ABC transporter permease [Anaerolineae bacterium]|nr:ABC transporter permease [Anaerolineae bacterium]